MTSQKTNSRPTPVDHLIHFFTLCDYVFRSLMEFLGIKFAPWELPRERRLQTLAAAAWISVMLCGELTGIALAVLLIRTDYYWLMLLYAVIIARNRDNCNYGGKAWSWVRNWVWWDYFRDYFPMKLVKTVDLDPERNYLMCVFPHGVLCTGAFASFGTDALGFPSLFPGLTPHILVLGGHFMVPFFRELLRWLGVCAASAQSISYLLDPATGKGRCAALMVGGAAESLNCHSGEYRVVLRKRRGFVKLAMRHGAPLVPVISFGETELFEQPANPPGGVVRTVQEWIKRVTGIAPVLPLGRGVFQYSIGIVPQRKPVVTVVGAPMEVAKNLNPSEEDITQVHEQFIQTLLNMFEKEKYKYLTSPKYTPLIIE